MDLGTTIIGLFSLALFIVPILYIQRGQRQQKKKFLEDFLKVTEGQQLSIRQYDSWPPYFSIGIDPVQRKLSYLKKQDQKEQTALIDLSEVASCRVVNEHRDVNGTRVIDFVALRFAFRNPRLSEQALEFYDREESMSLNEELMLAEKWQGIVNAHLQGTPQATQVTSAGSPVIA
ncbi:hypothetical protein CLV24_12379 [Pontibacter ummariensis]|uniref:Uncharacterized protein n=1 Tax=Pontibacter ummariensis TaxID=1610492 RepID=A0A239JTP8_9BACT|nr:hypothetical protein [Pontibacter ummariensis]PRY07430.1 hypothetical protein CLV24_12379 [Pontibacter ummariensis]SNT09241.1 hypothetical protein SAMN06296052_12379 [Pontibacter ummariensis]